MIPLKQVYTFKSPSEELIAAYMKAFDCDWEEALKRIENNQPETWVNDIYQVALYLDPQSGFVQINIRRRDGNVIFRDWRHFQQIKNQLLGEECEAIELYPAESRLVDTANKYHLFGCRDPKFRFPIGWQERDVSYKKTDTLGLRQRPFGKERGPGRPPKA